VGWYAAIASSSQDSLGKYFNRKHLGTLIIKLDRPKTLLKSHKLNLDFVEVNDSVESRRMPFRIHLLDGKSILDTGSRVQIFDVQISFKVS
jgi:hypothetical protein